MGSGSSKLGSRPSRSPRRVDDRNGSGSRLFSFLTCGRSSSRATLEMENKVDKIMVKSSVLYDPIINEVQIAAQESSLDFGRAAGSNNSDSETVVSSETTVSECEKREGGIINLEKHNQGKCMTASKQLIAPSEVSDSYSHDKSCRNRIGDEASTSVKEQSSSDFVSVNVSSNDIAVNCVGDSDNKGVSQIFSGGTCSSNSSPPGPEDSCPAGDSQRDSCPAEIHVGNHLGETMTVNSSSGPSSRAYDLPVIFRSPRDESPQDSISSDLGFLMSNREQGREDGSLVHVDVLSVSSSTSSGVNADSSSRDARRNSRRLFWDAFSRRSSRRHVDSPTFVFSTDSTDDPVSNDRWLLDFSGDFLNDGMGADSGYLGSRIHRLSDRRRHSRSEIWGRLLGARDENGQQRGSCPSGLHAVGTCSCESLSTTEESGTRASISRIVMLAEALFEVLDEIHRQPMSLSLSMVSLPAPDSVVDSFPLRCHRKTDKLEVTDDVEQCYICLAEYEEGDKIRVLPCQHEYHMSCVDKWLKEIHGVCPLCRGDVRRCGSEASVSPPDSEIPSS